MPENAVVLEVDGCRTRIRAEGVEFWVTSEADAWIRVAFDEALANFFARMIHQPAYEGDYFRSARMGVQAPAPVMRNV